MPDIDIIATKLLPPRRRSILFRERLIARLKRGLKGKLTVITADAGYGKTTLVTSLTEVCPDFTFCWYRLDAADCSAGIFLKYFVEAVHSHYSNFGAGVSLLLDNGIGSARDIEKVVTAFVNDFVSSVPDSVVFVLEDLHSIDDCLAINQFLIRLLELLPENLHLLVTSRIKPDLPISPLMARGEVNIISGNDLRFNDGEINELIQNSTDLKLHESEINYVKGITEGWISVIVLIMEIIRYMDTDARLSYLKHFKGDPDIFSFFAREIFDQQTDIMQEFLLKTAILDTLDVSIVNELLGLENTHNLLDQLYKGNLLVYRYDEHTNQYRFHLLMRTFLQEKLVSTYDKSVVKELHLKAGIIYRTRNIPSQAIDHFLAAEAYGEALPIVISYLPSLITNFHLEAADTLVAKLPPQIAFKDFSIMMEIGELRRHQGRVNEAIGIYRACVELAKNCDNDDLLAEALFWLATTAFDYSDGDAILPDVVTQLSRLGSSNAKINLELIKSCIYLIDSNFIEAYKTIVKAIDGATGNERKYPQCLSMLQALCFGLGKFREATAYFDKEYKVMKERGYISKASDMLALDNSVWIVAVCHYCMGNALELEALIERFSADADEQMLIKVSPIMNLIRAFITIIRQQYGSSLEWLRKSSVFVTSEKRMSAFTANEETSMVLRRELAHVYMLRGELNHARACIERNMMTDIYKTRLDFRHLIDTDMAELAIVEGNPESVQYVLIEALEYQKKAERPFEIVRTLALLTRLSMAMNREDEAPIYFNKAVELAKEHDFAYQIVREFSFNEAIPFLQTVVSENNADGLFIVRAFSAFAPNHLKKILYSKPQPDVVKKVPRRSNGSLRLLTFGGFHAELNGSPVRSWRKNKAKALLALLLAAEGREIPRERLIESLWPEVDLDDGRNNLRNTIFALKKALSGAEDIVQISRDSIRLVIENCTWDVPDFHRLIYEIKKLTLAETCVDPVKIEELLRSLNNIYRGEFLPELLFADLFIEQRHRFNTEYCDALIALGQKARDLGNNELALACFHYVLDTDGCVERAHISLMEIYLDSGDREAALRQYRDCSDKLERELGVSPSDETVMLFERLLGENRQLASVSAALN